MPPSLHPPGKSETPGLARNDANKPFDIEAEQGIEWRQDEHVYIARGNAKVARGALTVMADTLTGHYRPSSTQNAGAVRNQHASQNDDLGGSTEIYRVEADGSVRITSATDKVTGSHAVYDTDAGTLTVTGRSGVGENGRAIREPAIAERDEKRLQAESLTAKLERDAGGTQHISRIDARGDVVVASADQVGYGDRGTYNVDTGIATLAGHVRLARAGNLVEGQYATVDLNKHVSRLLSAPPDGTPSRGESPRVEGVIMPRQKRGDDSHGAVSDRGGSE